MSLATTIFWSSENIPAKVIDILALLYPKMDKLTISHQSSILKQISLFLKIFKFLSCFSSHVEKRLD